MMLKFEWDEQKNNSNQRKHGISFEEACSVFWDENATQFFDEAHSNGEERFLLLGVSNELRILMVCHCERENGDTIRLISARKATKSESKFYAGEN